ncbi:MAG: alpha/beta fold hydrolase [Candidatus Kapabacteria bacterium]|nr:alpha/beta fold hydrolase [Candidatus Kapabacteria bacterium]
MFKPLLFALLISSLHFSALANDFSIKKLDSTVKKTDFFFTTKDGTKIECTKFVQLDDTYMPDNGWPAIVYCHGYGDNKDSSINTAYSQALYGYYTLCYSMRGQGKSGGESNLISTTEMNDLKEIINYVKHDKKAGIDSTHIGITGSSQGGMIPYMAACNGLDVRMIMSDLASPEFASNWIENGCVKSTLFFSVDYDSTTVRYNNEVKKIREYILSSELDKWDSLAALMPKNRDFSSLLNKNKVPILLSNAWMDEFFNATGNIKAANQLSSPFRMYFGAIDGHGSDSAQSENDFLSDYQGSWMDYWLYDDTVQVLKLPKFTYASSLYPLNGNMWSFKQNNSDSWPPSNVSNLKLYFHTNHSLGLKPNPAGADTLQFENIILDSTYTLENALDDEFTGLDFWTSFRKTVIFFETAPLQNPFQLVGAPKVNINYSTDANAAQFNFQIWEIIPGQDAHLVTRINFADRHATPNQINQASVEGLAHSHIFQKGNKIRIMLTNLDTQPADSFLTTNPYVLPLMLPAKNTLYMSPKYLSNIEFPVKDLTPDAVADDFININNNSLNIFPNPATNEVSITNHESGITNIKIYDSYGENLLNININNFNNEEIKVNIKSFPPGLYLIQVGNKFGKLIKI